jgi:hypothetical protein
VLPQLAHLDWVKSSRVAESKFFSPTTTEDGWIFFLPWYEREDYKKTVEIIELRAKSGVIGTPQGYLF